MSERAVRPPAVKGPPDRREIAVLLGAIAAGAALRIAFIFDLRHAVLFEQPVLDSLEYLLMARRILEVHVLWDEVTIHSPLYAYWLAGLLGILRDNLDALRAVQAVALGSCTTLLAWAMARRCAGPIAGGASAWLSATLWPLVYHDTELLVEPLAIALNAAALWVLMASRGRPAILALAGFALGLSVITRPNAAAFVPVAALWAAWNARGGSVEAPKRERPRTRRAAAGNGARRSGVAGAASAVILGAAIAVLPVLLRNHALSGAWILQTNSGLNFYMGNYPGADGTPNIHAGRPWARLVAMAPERGILTPTAQDAFYRGLALRWMTEEPGRALALFWRKVCLFWIAYETRPSLDVYYFRRLSRVLSLPWPGFGVLSPLALLGAGLVLRRRRPETDLLLLYALVYTFATAAFMVSSRYRIPIVPAAVPLAGIGVAELARRLRSGRPRDALALLAVLVVLVVAVRWTPPELRVRDNAEERYNEGTRLMEQGRLPEAERAFRAAWAERKDDGRIAGNLGTLLVRTGRAQEAIGWLRTAVRLYPELAEVWANLGTAALLAGDKEESERAYHESLQRDPNRGTTRLGFGFLLLARGDREGAAREFALARRLGARLPPEAQALLPPSAPGTLAPPVAPPVAPP